MFIQSIVIVFIRAFVINARCTEFRQDANISGNLLEYNNTVNYTSLRIPSSIIDFLQLLPIPNSSFENNPNTLKYYRLIPNSSIFDFDCLLLLLIRRYRFLTLIVYVVSRKIVRNIKRVNYIIIN